MARIEGIDGTDEYNRESPIGSVIGIEDIYDEPGETEILFDDEEDLGRAIDRIYRRGCRVLKLSNWRRNPRYHSPPSPEEIEEYGGFDYREDMDEPSVYFMFICTVKLQWVNKD